MKRSLLSVAIVAAFSVSPVLVSKAVYAETDAEARNVTLNFKGADIDTVVQTLGKITGRTFLVDPRVKGTFNFWTEKPVTQEEAYNLFLTAIQIQGYAAVEENNIVRVVPDQDAKYFAAFNEDDILSNTQSSEMSTRIFQLNSADAGQALTLLRPMIGRNSTISADAESNTLVITDYLDNLRKLERIIRRIDQSSEAEPRLYSLEHAGAGEMAALLRMIFPEKNKSADGLDIATEYRTNTLILKSRNSEIVDKAISLLKELDKPTPAAANVHVVPLKNADAVRVAETLRAILTADESALSSKKASLGAKKAVENGSSEGAGLTPGMVQADAASNSVIVTAPESAFYQIKEVIEQLDVRRAQVLVEALVVEISADKAAEFGTQWVVPGGSSGGKQAISLFGPMDATTNVLGEAISASSDPTALVGLTQGFTVGVVKGVGNDFSLGVLARAMESQANANILATPTLMTLDNEESEISVGTNVPFTTGSYTLTGNTASPFQTIERRDVGLVLRVKPQITDGGTIRMEIYQELSKLRSISGASDLATDKRSIDSTVLVDDGQIIALGGMIQDQVMDVEDRVPILGHIPILGNLFKYNTREYGKTNLMVFLRPQVIRDAETSRQVSLDRYEKTQGSQKAAAPKEKTLMPSVDAPILPDY